jgi:sulfite exporter TauE/SafE
VKLYDEIALAAGVLLVLFLVLKGTGIMNASFSPANNPSSLLIVLMVGLLAGVSTCMALVGGLVLGMAAKHAQAHPEASAVQKFRPHIFFNIGRIGGYAVLGGMVGFAGQAFQLSGTLLGALTIGVGLVMLLLGVQLTQLSPRLSRFTIALPASFSKMLGVKPQHNKEYSHRNAMTVGVMTFFLPCGFTQAMQLYAMSTGSFWSGAMIMGAFAVGTAPGLLGLGGLTSVLKGLMAQRFFKLAGLAVVGLAFFNISNGLNLTGLPIILANSVNSVKGVKVAADTVAISNNGGEQVQEVRMEQMVNGYKPNNFTVKVGVPVKWVITSTNPNSCAGSLYSQQLGLRRNLKLGENIVEFLPEETGQIRFSCAMGMYTGVFNVVADEGAVIVPSARGKIGLAKAVSVKVVDAQQPYEETSLPSVAGCGGGGSGGCEGCGGGSNKAKPAVGETIKQGKVQLIRSTYTRDADVSPNQYTVKLGQPVRFEIEAKDNGSGCMGSITVPGLTTDVKTFNRGEKTVLEFTPTKAGTYPITCAMGVPRGNIVVS